jgi:hypothetical protein
VYPSYQLLNAGTKLATYHILGAKMIACRILVGKPEGRRPRRRWVENVKIDLREIERDGMDWIELAQDWDQWRALVNTVMNIWVP